MQFNQNAASIIAGLIAYQAVYLVISDDGMGRYSALPKPISKRGDQIKTTV